MGRSYLFECPRCGYRAKVSGGPDRGVDVSIQTILCRDCKALYDAVVRLKASGASGPSNAGLRRLRMPPPRPPEPPAFESVLNRLPPSSTKRLRWIDFKLRCPVSPVHRIRPWNEPDQCPRCGVYLEKGALPFRLWD